MSSERPFLIDVIKNEHKHLSSRIDMLSNELNAWAESREPDRQLLKLLAEFFRIFPDEIHHKKEDYIYEALIRNGLLETDYLVRLKSEHKDMHKMTEEFLRDLDKLLEKSDEINRSLVDNVEKYIALQKLHMADEESQFLPLAQSCLPEARFAQIDQQIQLDLIGEEAHQVFRKLVAIDAEIDNHMKTKRQPGGN